MDFSRLTRQQLERALLLARELKRRNPWNAQPGPQELAFSSEADITGYGGAAGGGKRLAVRTPIPTPTGWTTMGALTPGDEVFDEQGQPCLVTVVSPIETSATAYRLTFDDGQTLDACAEHRWLTYDAKELGQLTRKDPTWRAARRAKRPSTAKGNKSAAFTAAIAKANAAREASTPAPTGSVRNTQEIVDTLLTSTGRRNHAVPVAQAVQCADAELLVPPYTLGAWLGDGSSRNGQLTGIDPGIWERIEADGFEMRHYSAQAHNILGLMPKLRALGVLGNKHVPPAYLRASEDQRLALLQGLMDADGHAALDGACEFDNTRRELIDAVFELVVSLGMKASITEGRATLDGRDCGAKWRVKFMANRSVFGLARKLERLRVEPRRTNRFRYIVKAERIEPVPMRCIAVDSPSRLYLAGRAFIPTHNTDLIVGLSTAKHKRVLIIRREKAQTEGIIQRLTEIVGNTVGFNSQKSIWRVPVGSGPLIEFGGLDNPGDERRWQGRPHDLKAFDEATEMREAQVRFIMGWTRTNDPTLRPRVLMTFNPPTTQEGRWIIKFFAPWLDPKHPCPAMPGELRYFTTIGENQDYELTDGRAFVLVEGEPTYDFDPAEYKPEQIIKPKSRTFIPARLTDNSYYMATDYMSQLQALPEPLRSQMLNGDFLAGVEDDVWQVIPTRWVEIAQERWKARNVKPPMDSMGVDVARGGKDNTVLSRRHGWWFDELLVYPGTQTPNGHSVAGLVITHRRDEAPIHIDVIGVGSSPYDVLNTTGHQVLGVNVAEGSIAKDRSGRLGFVNQRSEGWWRMRELLDPDANNGIELPPDPRLLAELCTPRWRLQGSQIRVESREEIIADLRVSPDRASALILAAMETPKRAVMQAIGGNRTRREHDPYANL